MGARYERLFRDRQDAGAALAGLLDRYSRRSDVVVIGIPRGGVPIAYEVASALGAPLDVLGVRRLGVPGREEVAMGAVASGVFVLDDDVVRGLRVAPEEIQLAVGREGRELARREETYRDGRPMLELAGCTVIVVDDGMAMGVMMRAAIQALRERQPARIVVAVPALPESTCRELFGTVEEVVCATTPSEFTAVGEAYWDYAQITDEDVRDLLRAAAPAQPVTTPRAPTEAAIIRAEAVPADAGVPDDDALFELVGDAHVVLIGEGSHGTHEFYVARNAMTRRLIEEKGFCAVAVEADWPDAYRVNRYVRGQGDDRTAEEALRGFDRFPSWVWRNVAVRDFVGWLRAYNDRTAHAAGFYGLDLYSLYRSMHEVVSFLDRVDPAAAARARRRYACFDHFSDGENGQAYGFAAAFGAGETCEDEIVAQLVELEHGSPEWNRLVPGDEWFYAERNAKTVVAAAEYYRSMFAGSVPSWNLRDRHMFDTLEALAEHLGSQRGEAPRLVVWAHNSHVGDARTTEFAARHETSLGELVRGTRPDDSCLIGLTTYTGTVTAADAWGGPPGQLRVRPAHPDSVEELFHDVGAKSFLVPFGVASGSAEVLRSARLERAIGVVYWPDTERESHYFRARASEQFDAIVHTDQTRAVEPLEQTTGGERGEVSQTYPFSV